MAEQTTISGCAFEILAEQDDGGGGYEWSHVALVRRMDSGELFLLDEGGCSCNGPWVDTTISDLEPVTSWQEAVEKVKAEQPYFFTADDIAAFAQQLMTLRPEPSRG